MKRSIFALLLAMAMVVCFAAFTVSADETTEAAAHTDHCVCGGGAEGVQDHECEVITWTPISEAIAQTYYTVTETNEETGETVETKVYRTTANADLGALPAGNYYLDADVTIAKASEITKDKILNICLNVSRTDAVSLRRSAMISLAPARTSSTVFTFSLIYLRASEEGSAIWMLYILSARGSSPASLATVARVLRLGLYGR